MITRPLTVADVVAPENEDTLALPNEDSWDQFADLAEAEFERLMQKDERFRSYIIRETMH